MPRVETTTRTLYTYDELTDDAKERARDWWRQHGLDYEWWDSCYDTIRTAADMLGIIIANNGKSLYFSGFSYQGDGASYEGTYYYASGWRKQLLNEFGNPDNPTNKECQDLQSIGYDLQHAQQLCNWEASATISCTNYHHLNIDVHDSPRHTLEDDIAHALRDFASWAYRILNQEYDWLNSDEQVAESLIVNEYEFLVSGEQP